MVPDHQEERSKPKGDQSDQEEKGSRSSARTARIEATDRSLSTRVAQSMSSSRGTEVPEIKSTMRLKLHTARVPGDERKSSELEDRIS
ncbi:hypothetical protein TNCV_2074991 [Trichonephila clavipes]|nr:hypothetical protein TNCV_2074991 [Trichonephila clavipes]